MTMVLYSLAINVAREYHDHLSIPLDDQDTLCHKGLVHPKSRWYCRLVERAGLVRNISFIAHLSRQLGNQGQVVLLGFL